MNEWMTKNDNKIETTTEKVFQLTQQIVEMW